MRAERERARQDQLEREREAKEERQRQAERERIAKAEQERQAQEAYDTNLRLCERYDLAACHRISNQPLPVPGLGMAESLDRISHKNMRFNATFENARTFHLYLKQCDAKKRLSCEAALAMPGITQADRTVVAEIQAALPWFNIDDPKHFMWTLIALPIFGFLAFLVLSRRSPANIPSYAPDARPLDRLYCIARSRIVDIPSISLANARAALARLFEPFINSARTASAAPSTSPQQTWPRDPATAHAALQLAHSYLSELPEQLASEVIDNPENAAAHRSTLALAAKQLDIAQRADPTLNLVIDGDDSGPLTLSQQRLRARTVQLEGLTWCATKPRREIQLLTQATEIDPTFAPAFHSLGVAHFLSRNRKQAVAALQRACALDPDNIETHKALDRARNMTDAEIATYKLSNAAARTASAGVRTWNVMKLIWILGLPLLILFIIASFTGSMGTAFQIFLAFIVLCIFAPAIRWLLELLNR